MQTYLIEKTDKSVKLGFKDANLTIINPIIKALNENPDVKLVRYVDPHPELQDRALFVEVRNGDVMEAIEKATQSVSAYYTN